MSIGAGHFWYGLVGMVSNLKTSDDIYLKINYVVQYYMFSCSGNYNKHFDFDLDLLTENNIVCELYFQLQKRKSLLKKSCK